MACTPIITGDRFLARVLEHIDCQAETLGTFGYQALAQPDSPAAVLVSGLLTLFVAIFGIRLLLGYPVTGRDAVTFFLKIGIVLTLAFSWPAFKTVIYDVAIKGPGEIAAYVAPAGSSASADGLAERLAAADTALLRLTEYGTGRTTGRIIDRDTPGGTFQASPLEDEHSFGLSRVIYLAAVIGTLALLRVLGGLLLALAPLAGGMLLFEATRGVFAGWLKGLVLVMVGSTGAAVVLAVELAVLEPWLADALRVRTLGYATPAAPTEILALTLAFALVHIGSIWLLAKVAFYRGWPSFPVPVVKQLREAFSRESGQQQLRSELIVTRDRALQTAGGVERMMRSESLSQSIRTEVRSLGSGANDGGVSSLTRRPRLGELAPRTAQRGSLAARSRDRQ